MILLIILIAASIIGAYWYRDLTIFLCCVFSSLLISGMLTTSLVNYYDYKITEVPCNSVIYNVSTDTINYDGYTFEKTENVYFMNRKNDESFIIFMRAKTPSKFIKAMVLPFSAPKDKIIIYAPIQLEQF